MRKQLAVAMLAALIAGCGGGGDDGAREAAILASAAAAAVAAEAAAAAAAAAPTSIYAIGWGNEYLARVGFEEELSKQGIQVLSTTCVDPTITPYSLDPLWPKGTIVSLSPYFLVFSIRTADLPRIQDLSQFRYPLSEVAATAIPRECFHE